MVKQRCWVKVEKEQSVDDFSLGCQHGTMRDRSLCCEYEQVPSTGPRCKWATFWIGPLAMDYDDPFSWSLW